METKIAVAILNWNGEKLLFKFLPSVISHSKNADIYVIDNASTDQSISFLKNNYPLVKIIQNKKNLGFAKGYNEGIKLIKHQYICLLNSDVEVTKDWLTPIINLLDQDLDIVAVQPKILDYNKKSYFEYAGAGGGFIDKFGYPFCRGRIFSTLEKDEGQYDDTIECFWASGASLFVRRKDFVEIGGFDEDFFAHMEEIDLCWRLINKGKKIFYCGNSTVYHVGGSTLNKNNLKKTYFNYRNSLCTDLKNLPRKDIFRVIFVRLLLDGISVIVFLPRRGFSYLRTVFISHIHFYMLASRMFKKRKLMQTSEYGYKKLLPYQYYLKNRKFFKDLK